MNKNSRNFAVLVQCKLAEIDLRTARRAVIASELGVHDMTLARGLHRQGHSWQALLDSERRRRCERTLRANPRACMYRLMSRCGVGRQHMSNSVSRWFGATLSEIRASEDIFNRVVNQERGAL